MLLVPLPDQPPEMASPVTPPGLDFLGCIFGVGTKRRPPGYCLILHKVVLESM